jgi:hypothetical protein
MLNIIAELQEEIDKIEEVPKNDVEYPTICFYDDSKGFERTVEALEDVPVVIETPKEVGNEH